MGMRSLHVGHAFLGHGFTLVGKADLAKLWIPAGSSLSKGGRHVDDCWNGGGWCGSGSLQGHVPDC